MILVDGHVHLYPAYRAHTALNAAGTAFRAARRARSFADDGSDCLVLVDPKGVRGFDRLRERGATGWLVASADSTSLVVTREDDGMRIVVIAGRQIRTEGGLEVLSFFSRDVEKDGRPLATVVEEVLRVGGVPVVPWGFGKWWGQRGAQVRDLLESSLGPHVMLADSSTRPRLMPRPPGLFKLATGLGVRILAGTDPLPFPGQERKIGRYGFILEGDLRLDRPAVGLRERLLETRMSPPIYGTRERILAAVRLQTAMQIRRVRARAR